MKADQFLQNPFTIAEEWEEDEKILNLYREYKDADLERLIELYAVSEIIPEKADDATRRKVLREIIAFRLGIPTWDYFIDMLNERFELMNNKITKLSKYETHRHKTIMGLYTEKPVY